MRAQGRNESPGKRKRANPSERAGKETKETADENKNWSRLNVLSSPWEPFTREPKETTPPGHGSVPTQASARQTRQGNGGQEQGLVTA